MPYMDGADHYEKGNFFPLLLYRVEQLSFELAHLSSVELPPRNSSGITRKRDSEGVGLYEGDKVRKWGSDKVGY